MRVYGPRRSRGPYTRKKERGQYQAILTEQAWLIKDLLWLLEKFFLAGQGG